MVISMARCDVWIKHTILFHCILVYLNLCLSYYCYRASFSHRPTTEYACITMCGRKWKVVGQHHGYIDICQCHWWVSVIWRWIGNRKNIGTKIELQINLLKQLCMQELSDTLDRIIIFFTCYYEIRNFLRVKWSKCCQVLCEMCDMMGVVWCVI